MAWLLFDGRFCRSRQTGESCRILQCDISKDLPIHIDAGLLQSGDELVVVQSVQARRRTDANDPQAAEVTLSHLAIAIGIDESFLDGFFRKLIKFALVQVVALRQCQQLLAAMVAFCSAFY